MSARALISVVILLACALSPAHAEITRDAAARLCLDVVLLKRSRELRGSIVARGADGSLTMAVRREWLIEREPRMAEELAQQDAKDSAAGRENLIKRIEQWIAERAENAELVAILRSELADFERNAANPDAVPEAEPSEFLLIDVAAEDLRRVFAQPPRRKQVGLAAWQVGIEKVEELRLPKLEQTLVDRGIDWNETTVDLSDRLPAAAIDDDRAWAARKAVYEYAFRKRLDFQGTGDFVVEAGDQQQQPAGAELLAALLNGGLGGDLSDLLNEALGNTGQAKPKQNRPTWLQTAAKAADEKGLDGFRVTRMEHDLAGKQVTVESRFVVRMPDDGWETIWLHTQTEKATADRKGLEDRIRQDEQLIESLKLLESLGLKGNVDTAIQFGAATMDAQQKADDRFYEFKDRYTKRLDGPPLRWSDSL